MTTILLFAILIIGIIILIILRDIQKKLKSGKNEEENTNSVKSMISDSHDSLLREIQELDEKFEDIKQETNPYEELSDDELYNEVLKIVKESRKASASFLQRKLRIGYARAARIIDTLEENGVVSSSNGAEPRKVLMK
jgi:DNA segregation ATPase FtsK/SpoIIIE-like protein